MNLATALKTPAKQKKLPRSATPAGPRAGGNQTEPPDAAECWPSVAAQVREETGKSLARLMHRLGQDSRWLIAISRPACQLLGAILALFGL